MRMSPRIKESILFCLAFTLSVAAFASWMWFPWPDGRIPVVYSQNPETMSAEQSEAKGKELIQKAITALGGQAYLNVRDMSRTGRLAIFDSQGEVGGYAKFQDFVKLPDKDRTEYFHKRNVIDVITATGGWSLDRGGVTDSPQDQVDQHVEGLKKDIDNLFRARLAEEGLRIRFGGTDIVDMKQVIWVEVTDKDRLVTRIALDASSYIPVRAVYITRNKETRQRVEEKEFFSTYFPFGGVMTAKQIFRERNGRKVFQVFLETCQYNTNLSDALFTRASLEERWKQLDKGKKKKDKEKP